jgi:predicted PurR-regulated permease PerM
MSALLVRRIVAVASVLAALVIAGFVAGAIPKTLTIFAIAALIAFGVLPLVRGLERVMPRVLAIALVYAGLLGLLTVVALVVVPISYAQLLVLAGHTGEYVNASQQAVGQLEDFLRFRLGDRIVVPTMTELQAEVGGRVGSIFTMTLTSLGTLVFGAVNAILIGVSALILSVFFLVQGREVRDAALALLAPTRRARAERLWLEIGGIFGRFVAGQLTLCAIVGGAVWVVLAPAHFGFALLLAILCALGYAVPFFGMIVAQVLAAALAVPQGLGMVIYVTLAIFVIARIADNILVPKVLGDSVGVSPITIMFAVFAGGELFGLTGLLLAIPVAALVRLLFRYFVLPAIVQSQREAEVVNSPTEPERDRSLREVPHADAR